MTLTEQQKQKFLEYVERKRLESKPNGNSQKPTKPGLSKKGKNDEYFELFSIDYLEMCLDDILLKMSKTKAYQKQSDEQKENISVNLRLEFLEAILEDVYKLFEKNNMLDTVEQLGEDAKTMEGLMEVFAGLVATVPFLSGFTINSIISKYKSLCDEMDYVYDPNLIYSQIKEIV